MKKYDVLAIGSIAIEFNLRATDGLIAKHNLNKSLGTPVSKETFAAIIKNQKIESKAAGGAVVNVSLGINMRGGNANVIGKVANDNHGQFFINGVKAKGLQYKPVISSCHKSHTTSIATIITPDKERSFAYTGEAAYEIAPEDINHELISQSRLVYIDSYIWASQNGKSTAHHAAILAKQFNAKVAMSLNGADIIAGHRSEFLFLAKSHADILVGDKREFMSLLNTKTFEETIAELKKLDCIASITDGSNGAYIVVNGAAIHIPTNKVDNIVDTCGAGDQFAAGFIYGILQGKTLKESGHMGADWAAEVIQHTGAHPQLGKSNNKPSSASFKL